jgi:hypothetical protein
VSNFLSLLPDSIKRALVLKHHLTKLHGEETLVSCILGTVWDIDVNQPQDKLARHLPSCLRYGDKEYITYDFYLQEKIGRNTH